MRLIVWVRQVRVAEKIAECSDCVKRFGKVGIVRRLRTIPTSPYGRLVLLFVAPNYYQHTIYVVPTLRRNCIDSMVFDNNLVRRKVRPISQIRFICEAHV